MTHDSVAQALFSAKNAAVVSHINPDGDAVGSALAMALALEGRGVHATVLLPSPFGAEYSYLPELEKIRYPEDGITDDFDLLVCLDCSGTGRVGAFDFLFEKKDRPTVIIDHHVTSCAPSPLCIVESDAAATGEILTRLFDEWNVSVTPEIATCLLTAVMTDTGGFAFSNTHPATLRAAARLVECGASAAQIHSDVYATRRLSKTRLIGRALEKMQEAENGQVLWSVLTRADFADCHAADVDTDGIIDFLRDADTCRLCAIVRDTETGSKASFRCAEEFDVAKIGASFGGGGHQLAAGCSFDVPAEEAAPLIRDALIAALREAK